MKVNILLSTYNGEKYLAEQVNSIQKQSFTDWNLLIRDDGSTDNTVRIIRELAERDKRIKFINDGNVVNLGVIRSFYELLTYEQADYYLFCDQDDYWLEDKIQTQIEEALRHPVNEPHMNYMDPVVVNSQLETINSSMIRSQSGHANTQLRQELTENTVTGGVSLINHALAEKWVGCDSRIMMHDWFLALCACAFGSLVFIDKPGELYRQHDSNVLGARTLSKRLRTIAHPIALVRKYWTLIRRSQQQAAILLTDNYKSDLRSYDREMINEFINITEQSFTRRIAILRRFKLRKNKLIMSLAFWLLLITKWGYEHDGK
ncbi:glycosyltransferase family 2 protein [Alloscardovia theropitheci]|uniref:Glycosyltransferase family 2 protein n=1 Tax=Alloscardovia theropitheci TaxID=2496842 RepID=A0A4R0QUN5_9BIFI|nr:glycosyltransferase family 2 protein [Alloscardovia theropitheci]TCD53737.1 glycosyltransferase family 2 protein [Alloscardovia theropitheci]